MGGAALEEATAVDPLLALIIVMSVALFLIAVYMEWLGLLSVVTFRTGPKHSGCGHPKLTPANGSEMCWHCRHQHLDQVLHLHVASGQGFPRRWPSSTPPR